MKSLRRAAWITAAVLLLPAHGVYAQDAEISRQSRSCMACHRSVTPGIVADWENSRMSHITPAEAMQAPENMRRVSFETLPEQLKNVAVGCAECHTLRADEHEDTFKHSGQNVHTVVSPDDCAQCHPAERKQFSDNLMAEAYGNLMENSLYDAMITAVNGPMNLSEKGIVQQEPDPETNADSCLFCHGTRLSVQGTETRQTSMGPMNFPVLEGWPNQGVGRINTDKSRGSCSACHPRHRFSIETARKPETCSQCHKGPDVPAYKVYSVSKHGNIYNAGKNSSHWDFSAVPWTVGKDMESPTCATCHISLLTDENNQVIAKRTHRMNDRLAWRIFGLPYAHAHPAKADTTIIKSKDGLPLPTALDGTPAREYLIDKQEQDKRNQAMQQICRSCHSTGWVQGHFRRLEHTIDATNNQTLVTTKILQKAWDQGAAEGPAQGGNPFDEAIERLWTESWLFYANSVRFASAMGGADYGVFAHGRWYLSRSAHQMMEMLDRK